MLNDYFVELTKAYKALTDEDIGNDYIQYGHPDGKQSFSIGIALPKFIVTGGNGKYVILVYAILSECTHTWSVLGGMAHNECPKEKVLIDANLFESTRMVKEELSAL